MNRKLRTIVGHGAVLTAAAALLATGLVEFESAPAEAFDGSVTATVPGTYTWTVPAGVTQISIEAYGAQGGGIVEMGQGVGGRGAEVKAVVPVSPGQVITYVVGAHPLHRAGGIGGGGDGSDAYLGPGAGGGGASWVKIGSTPLVVAGGGGGAALGGVNGGDSGHMGGSLRYVSTASGMGGLPGSSPGAMNTPGGDKAGLASDCRYRSNGVAGQPGSSFQGGAGGGQPESDVNVDINYGGGGGGGGYRGGAGGGGGAYCAAWEGETAAAGGGGGGISYVDSHAVAHLLTEGFQSGDGAVVIQY